MATHSSVLAWRIPGTGEPCGLPYMGLHRVGHDWSHLAADYVCWTCVDTIRQFYEEFWSIYTHTSKVWKFYLLSVIQSVHLLSYVQLFVMPWTSSRQASLSITNSRSLLKLMSTELVMPPNHLILCHPLLLLPSIFPSIRAFSNESVLTRWAKYWKFQLQHQSFQRIFWKDFL